MDTESIAYIGPKKVKNDNVAGTNVVWHGYGDIQNVPKVAASKLLAYPTVFITGAQFDATHAAPKAPELTAAQKAAAEELANKLAKEEADRVAAEAAAKKVGDGSNQGAGLSSVDKPDEDKKPEQLTGISTEPNARHQSVKAALLSMDTANEEHFSPQTGNPLIGVVREVAGDKTISLKEVNAAWSELKGAAK